MTRPLLPAVAPSNGMGLGPSRPGSEHSAPVAPCAAVLARIAELHEALARAHEDLARELEDCLAAGAAQSDVMDVPGAQEALTTKPVPRLISAVEVASRVGVSPTTVRRWRRNRVLPPGITVAGIVRWDSADIDAWIAGKKESVT